VPDVTLALGANLGDRKANLLRAAELLEEVGVSILRRSSIWETAPVPADQPRFLNAVVVARTGMAPFALLSAAKTIERRMGRVPGRRWGPRPIDIDILFYGRLSLASQELTIPHPRIAERDFVLVPLAEVMPGTLPVLGMTAQHLLTKLSGSSARVHSRFERPQRP
jgi:2-amino-4-hydroxy-6-hydroxymethyldihydropteridine diphosphokinase